MLRKHEDLVKLLSNYVKWINPQFIHIFSDEKMCITMWIMWITIETPWI